MPTYARIHEGTVVEIFVVPEDKTINDYFHSNVPFEMVDAGTRVGFCSNENGVLADPNPPPPPTEPDPIPEPITPVDPPIVENVTPPIVDPAIIPPVPPVPPTE